jgi:hypothetical protein
VHGGCANGLSRALPCGLTGGVAEWLKAHAWKVCRRETVSGVRIPLPPPSDFDFITLLWVLTIQPIDKPINWQAPAYEPWGRIRYCSRSFNETASASAILTITSKLGFRFPLSMPPM